LGEKTERILKFDHHRVSTFGVGDELDKLGWKAVLRQLLAAGYLKADLNSYGGFRLSEKSRFVLRKKAENIVPKRFIF
jgi:ATP-dependent DNA helicase RecQ